MRHACFMFLTSAKLALISPAGALIGVALGIASTGHLERSRERRAAKEAHEQVITEVQTAVVDLLPGVQAARSAYQHETPWRHYIRVAALVAASIGSIMTSGETLSWKLLDLHRLSPSLETSSIGESGAQRQAAYYCLGLRNDCRPSGDTVLRGSRKVDTRRRRQGR